MFDTLVCGDLRWSCLFFCGGWSFVLSFEMIVSNVRYPLLLIPFPVLSVVVCFFVALGYVLVGVTLDVVQVEVLFVWVGGGANIPPAVPSNGSSGSPACCNSLSTVIMILLVSSRTHVVYAVMLACPIICGLGNLVGRGMFLMFLLLLNMSSASSTASILSRMASTRP